MKERKKCSLPGKFPDVKRAGYPIVIYEHVFFSVSHNNKNAKIFCILQIYIYNERNFLHYSLELFISDSWVDDNIARN